MNLQTTQQIILEKKTEEKQLLKQIIKTKGKSKYLQAQLFLEYITENYLNKNQDCMILITGFKGKGKSSLALRLLLKYMKINPKAFPHHPYIKKTIKEQVIFESNPILIKQKIHDLPKKSMIIFDEGARFLLAEDWNKAENKKLKKVFAEVRTKNHIYIVNCPYKVMNVDKKYVGSLFEFWIHVFDWDKAVIFKRNANPSRIDFDLEFFEKKYKYINNQLTEKEWTRLKNAIAKKHENYFSTIKWGKIKPEIYSFYEKIRDAEVFKELKKTEELEQIKKEITDKEIELQKKKLDLKIAKIEATKKELEEKIKSIANPIREKTKKINKELENIFNLEEKE